MGSDAMNDLPPGFVLDTPQQQSPAPVMAGAQQPISSDRTPNLAAQSAPPPGFTIDQPQQAPQNSWSGAGKAALQGGVNAISGLAGIPGDITNLVTGGAHGSGFGSEAIQKGIEGYTGHYDPQTRLEKFIRTGAEFAPGMAFGGSELSLGSKLLRLVAAPAIASEAAGQLTEGTAAEPIARIAGGIGGGMAASKIGNMMAARSVAAANPMQGVEQIGQQATGATGYKSPELSAVQFKNDAIGDLQNQMRGATLPKEVAPLPNAVIDMLDKPIGGKANFGWEDVQRARQILGKEAGNIANPVSAGAAGKAKGALDTWLDNLDQSHLMTGDAQAALQTYRTANSNYQVMKALDMLQGKRYAADLSAAAANSGANFENAMRQRIKGILLSSKQRSQFENLSNGPEIIKAMEDVTRGGTSENLLRGLSNLLGGGMGMHAGWMGLAGLLSGHPETIAAPLAGLALKGFQNRGINSKLNNITNMVAQGAPANQAALRARNALQQRLQSMSPTQRALINAALSRQLATQQTSPTTPPQLQ